MCNCGGGGPNCCPLFAIWFNNWNVLDEGYWDFWLNGAFVKSLDFDHAYDGGRLIGGQPYIIAGCGSVFIDTARWAITDAGTDGADKMSNLLWHDFMPHMGNFDSYKEGYEVEDFTTDGLINGVNEIMLEFQGFSPGNPNASDIDIFIGKIIKHRGRWKICQECEVDAFIEEPGGPKIAQPTNDNQKPGANKRAFVDLTYAVGTKQYYEFNFPQ